MAAFRLLADRLAGYSPPPTTLRLEAWLNDVRPLTGGCKQFEPANVPAITRAIEQLEVWIATASPVVATRYPHVPSHAASLRVVPTSLRGSLALCSGMASGVSANYKIGVGWVRPGSDPFSKKMQGLSANPFFLDLRDPAVKNDEAFAGNQTVWVESRAVPIALLQNTDAIVWLKRVSLPKLPLPVLVIMGMHYRSTRFMSALLFVALGFSAIVWRWRRRASAAGRA